MFLQILIENLSKIVNFHSKLIKTYKNFIENLCKMQARALSSTCGKSSSWEGALLLRTKSRGSCPSGSTASSPTNKLGTTEKSLRNGKGPSTDPLLATRELFVTRNYF